MDQKIKWATTQLNSKFGNHKAAGLALLSVVSDLIAQLEESKIAAKKPAAKKPAAKKPAAKKPAAKKPAAKKSSAKKRG